MAGSAQGSSLSSETSELLHFIRAKGGQAEDASFADHIIRHAVREGLVEITTIGTGGATLLTLTPYGFDRLGKSPEQNVPAASIAGHV